MSKETFGKEERLCNRQLMDQLFEQGNSIKEFPFRLVWMIQDDASTPSLQIAISVPKKKVPLAAHRNRIKRQVRSVFRQQKTTLKAHLSQNKKQLACALIYLGSNDPDYPFLEDKISVTLQRLLKEV